MRATSALAVAVGLLLALPVAAQAQVEHHCKSVAAGKWIAKNVSAFNMGCRSTRSKLRRWLGRDRLPRNPEGWDCYRSGVPGKNRQCTTYETRTGDPKGFSFLMRRR
jgi:hypothetical protein